MLKVITGGKDTHLFGRPVGDAQTTNYGDLDNMGISEYSSYETRVVAHQSLSGVSKSLKVKSAFYNLYYYSYGAGSDPVGQTITLYKLRRNDWVELQATWKIYKTSSSWGSDGAANTSSDIDTSLSSSLVVPASFGWMAWDVTEIIKDALKNGVDFNIRGSIGSTGNYRVEFTTKDYADSDYHPYLELSLISPGFICFE